MTKQYPIIMQDFSIVGLKKQWENQISEELLEKIEQLADAKITHVARNTDIAGAKTETRRLTGLKEINENPWKWKFWYISTNGFAVFYPSWFEGRKGEEPGVGMPVTIKCPYGCVGDELWVKEAYQNMVGTFQDVGKKIVGYVYKADEPDLQTKWKSPLFMPKAASRITLEITGISVERLQDITEEGALREGVFLVNDNQRADMRLPSREESKNSPVNYETIYCSVPGKFLSINGGCFGNTASMAYQMGWHFLHSQESWNLNPWLWVIQFKVKEIKQ